MYGDLSILRYETEVKEKLASDLAEELRSRRTRGQSSHHQNHAQLCVGVRSAVAEGDEASRYLERIY